MDREKRGSSDPEENEQRSWPGSRRGYGQRWTSSRLKGRQLDGNRSDEAAGWWSRLQNQLLSWSAVMGVGGSMGTAERRLESRLLRDLELLKRILIRSGVTKTILRKNEGVFAKEEPVPDKWLPGTCSGALPCPPSRLLYRWRNAVSCISFWRLRIPSFQSFLCTWIKRSTRILM
jgi:hypothetical protein